MRFEYVMDTGWACGLIICNARIIVDAAPIFKKFIGQDIGDLRYKITQIKAPMAEEKE